MKHTPGPWRLDSKIYRSNSGGPHKHYEISGPFKAEWIALVLTYDDSQGEHEANARLIAAAPEMLEALKDAVALIDRRQRGFEPMQTIGDLRAEIIARADAAIAKAEVSA